MKDEQLDKLSYQDLLRLQGRIAALVEVRRASHKAEVRQKIEAIAAAAGMSLDDLVANRPRRGAKGKVRSAARPAVVVKYRHPRDASLTWTGRGRRPKWLAQSGGNIERFRVS